MAPRESPQRVRFGAFEVDLRVGELRKQGRKIKLQDRPFQFLALLLERPGQLVPREELVRRLWSENALIDVDNGLNTAAKKLRQALGDDAETPRFIETLPRRGYRFIAPVQEAPAAETEVVTEEAPDMGDTLAPPTLPAVHPVSDASGPAPARPARRRGIALAVLGVIGLTGLRLLFLPHAPSVLRTVRLTHSGRVEPSAAILTDGPRIYFSERSGGQWSLAQMSVEGGAPSRIDAPPGLPTLCSISPNGTELLVNIAARNEEETPIWIIPTVAGSPRRLGSILAHYAAWSRDGRSIIYGFGPALYRINNDGTGSRKLADTPGKPYFIHWSPAGRPDLLRFTLLNTVASIWECSPDGSGVRPYRPASRPWAASPRWELGAGWTPDGKYYLVQSGYDTSEAFWALRETPDLLHPFARRVFQIYTTPTGPGVLVPSVDGKRLFFATGQESRELVSYDGAHKQFLPFLSGAAVRGVTFSKDGQWVAYETIPEATLWRSRADGSDRLQLTSPPLRISEPQWSPDGQRIAFTGGHANSEFFAIYVVPANGGSVEAAPTEPRDSGSPSWSADSQSLMYSCWERGRRLETVAVCTLDWKTRKPTVLPGSQGLLRPAWSPDGRYVAALRLTGTQMVLYDMNSHQWVALADGANYGIPFWTRDSRSFYFQEVLGDASQPIFRVNVATRAVERMMSSREIPQSGFSGYTLTGLTPGGAPVATVLRSNGDLYALDVDLP